MSSQCSAGALKVSPVAAVELAGVGAAEGLLHIEGFAFVSDRGPVSTTGRVVNGNPDVLFALSLEVSLPAQPPLHLFAEIITHSLRGFSLHQVLLAGVQRVGLET